MGRIGWQGLCSGVREKDLSSSSLENIWAQQKTWNATQQRGAPLFPSPGNVSSCRVRLEPAVSSNPISLPAMGVPDARHAGQNEKVLLSPLGDWD